MVFPKRLGVCCFLALAGWWRAPLLLANSQAPTPAASYLLQRLDSLPSVYVLHVLRHDSLFKVVSKKVKVPRPAGVRLVVGNTYPLRLNNGLGFQSCLVGVVNGISLNWESGHDLYTAYNLKGLYLQQSPPAPAPFHCFARFSKLSAFTLLPFR